MRQQHIILLKQLKLIRFFCQVDGVCNTLLFLVEAVKQRIYCIYTTNMTKQFWHEFQRYNLVLYMIPA